MGRLGKMVEGWRAGRARRAVAALPEQGLPDLGITRADLEAAARMDGDRIARMTAMAELHGIGRAQLAGDPRIGNDVARTCAHCPEDAACRAEFARPGGADPARTGFCPNAGTFRAMSGRALSGRALSGGTLSGGTLSGGTLSGGAG